MHKNPLKGTTLLLIGSFIWGTTFVAQSIGTNHLDAFSFNCVRNFIGVFALIPVLLWQLCTKSKDMNTVQTFETCDNSQTADTKGTLLQELRNVFTRDLILGGIICGTHFASHRTFSSSVLNILPLANLLLLQRFIL